MRADRLIWMLTSCCEPEDEVKIVLDRDNEQLTTEISDVNADSDGVFIISIVRKKRKE